MGGAGKARPASGSGTAKSSPASSAHRKYSCSVISIASIINRAQMVPMHDHDIILLNDLYSEEDTRFRDRQRRSDTYINFLDFEPWLRPLMRASARCVA
jgi:hypothetical protein